jgi:hypothetical protein
MVKARLLLPLTAVTAVLALVLVIGGYDSARAGTFDPILQVDVATTDPNTPSDYTVTFGVPEGNVNFAGVVAFIPSDWGIIAGDAIEDGTPVGMLTADATLGLVNGSCSQKVPVEFEMYDASLDESETVSFEDLDEDLTRDFAENNIDPDIPDSVFLYPDFIPRVFDEGQQPVRRSAGVSIVAGTPVLLQFLIFPPGTFINENIPSDAELGYPSVTLLQNIGDPNIVPAPGVITDFCSPLTSVNQSFGGDASAPLYVNPQDGTYTFTVISAGQRDADNDGYENGLDTCPFEPNIGNPRVPNDGDLDSDGLDAVCDPNDDPVTGGTNSDEDGDGYLNRQDNCPLIANGERDEATTGNQAEDEDPGDGIGNPCDTNPTEFDGELIIETREVEVTIGAGTGAGGPPTGCTDGTYQCASSEGGGDGDGDGDGNGSENGDDDDGGSSALPFIIVGVIAAVVIIGGGAALLARRRGGGDGGSAA